MVKAYSRINWQNQPSTATAVGATLLNRIDNATNIIDDRVIELDTLKFPRSEALSMVASWDMDLSTGVIAVTLKDGTIKTFDTALEKVPISGVIDTDTNELVFTNSDGTTTRVDLAKLITQYEFVDTNTIGFVFGADGKVSCFVKNGSITSDKLEVNFLANCQLAALTATSQASLSKRYAVGGVEDGDTTDNAKYYRDQSKYYAEQAQAVVNIDIATESIAGLVKASDDVHVAADGTMSVPNKANKSVDYTFTLTSSGWIGSVAPFTQTVALTGIKATDEPFGDLVVTSGTDDTEITEYSKVTKMTTGNDTITAVCYKKKPTVALTIIIKVVG